MAQTANRTLQYSVFVSCSAKASAHTYAPGFDIRALALTLGPTGTKPIYLSLKGAATTGDCYLSTGQSVWWPSLPTASNTVSFISTSSGAEVSLTVFG
jgi:hypothetical protein